MRLNIPREKERELAPPGSHNAVCCTIADLGTQNGPYGIKRQLYLAWELTEELTSKGKPHVVGKFYTLTANAKGALRSDLESWFGRVLDGDELAELDLLNELLGRTCTIGIMHVAGAPGKMRAAITSVMLPRKGSPTRTPTKTDPIAFSLAEGIDRAAYDALPQWLRDIVSRSAEYRELTSSAKAEPTADRVKRKLNAVPKTAKSAVPDESVHAELDDAIPF